MVILLLDHPFDRHVLLKLGEREHAIHDTISQDAYKVGGNEGDFTKFRL